MLAICFCFSICPGPVFCLDQVFVCNPWLGPHTVLLAALLSELFHLAQRPGRTCWAMTSLYTSKQGIKYINLSAITHSLLCLAAASHLPCLAFYYQFGRRSSFCCPWHSLKVLTPADLWLLWHRLCVPYVAMNPISFLISWPCFPFMLPFCVGAVMTFLLSLILISLLGFLRIVMNCSLKTC